MAGVWLPEISIVYHRRNQDSIEINRLDKLSGLR